MTLSRPPAEKKAQGSRCPAAPCPGAAKQHHYGEQLELVWTPSEEDSAPPQREAASQSMAQDAASLQRELERLAGMPVRLTVTDNVTRMMFFQYEADTVKLRLHHMFLAAPREIREALAHWIKFPRSKKHRQTFRAFIIAHNHAIRPGKVRPRKLNARGFCYDLQAIYAALNHAYFGNAITAAIGWGRNTSGRLRSIRFGCYYDRDNIIYVHPRLDQTFVPPYVVRYIVYHEMLHAHLGVKRQSDGRRAIHTPAFKKQEAQFPEFTQAVAWIEDKKNLHRLLRQSAPAAADGDS